MQVSQGFHSDLLLAPDDGIGVVLMTNCDLWYVHTTSLALALLGHRQRRDYPRGSQRSRNP